MLAATYQYPILDFFLTMLYFFLFIIWIYLLIMVFVDVFRSHDMGGWAKALWVIFICWGVSGTITLPRSSPGAPSSASTSRPRPRISGS